MKDKYTYFILTLIAICLLYIGFLKPAPGRYILKEEQKENIQGSLETVTHTTSIFDTATGKNYVFIAVTQSNMQDGAQTTQKSYFVTDFVNGKVVHKDPEKDIKITDYKEREPKIPPAAETE